MTRMLMIAVLGMLAGCAGGPGGSARPAGISYASGPVPASFDLELRLVSKGRYELEGNDLNFSEVADEIAARGVDTILVRDVETVGDVICLAMLGLRTDAAVFHLGADNRPARAVWSADQATTASVLESCAQ